MKKKITTAEAAGELGEIIERHYRQQAGRELGEVVGKFERVAAGVRLRADALAASGCADAGESATLAKLARAVAKLKTVGTRRRLLILADVLDRGGG